ncbi:MAG TPA: hypothetical protein VFI02_04695, partial [Armatimonadota bacterium]|nr:hypothetical protein [Armatimonadota bacterium]
QADFERLRLEDKEAGAVPPSPKDTVDGLEFWVNVQGRTLKERNVAAANGKPLDDLTEYHVNAIMIGTYVIYQDLKAGKRPYSKVGWRSIPGSFWYKGVPELMEDLQKVCNAAVRALMDNMAVSSGPQAEVDLDRLTPGGDLEGIYPRKIWQTVNNRNFSSPAVRFFQPDSQATELLATYDKFAALADDYTGIPAYAYGNDKTSNSTRSSSGLSMLMSSSAKGVKRVILAIDKNIFKTVVGRQFDLNMRYLPDEDIKGDVNIVSTGAVAIMVKEQMAARRMEFLNATNNEVDMQLIGMEGRANVLREAVSSIEVEERKVVKSPEEVRDLVQEQKAQQEEAAKRDAAVQEASLQLQLQTAQVELQVKQMELETKKIDMQINIAKVELERMKIGIQGQKVEGELAIKGHAVEAKALKDTADATNVGMQMLTGALDAEDGGNVKAEKKGEKSNARKAG